MEYFVDADISELARQASHCSLTSYCSLADLPEYSIDPHELHQLIEQCAVPSSLIVPRSGLGTVWEYVRGAPRRPDSATSNSLCSADEHDMQEVMAEDEVPAAAQVGWRGDVSPPTGITAAMATTIYNEPGTLSLGLSPSPAAC